MVMSVKNEIDLQVCSLHWAFEKLFDGYCMFILPFVFKQKTLNLKNVINSKPVNLPFYVVYLYGCMFLSICFGDCNV